MNPPRRRPRRRRDDYDALVRVLDELLAVCCGCPHPWAHDMEEVCGVRRGEVTACHMFTRHPTAWSYLEPVIFHRLKPCTVCNCPGGHPGPVLKAYPAVCAPRGRAIRRRAG